MSTVSSEMEVLNALAGPDVAALTTPKQSFAEIIANLQHAQERVSAAERDVDDAKNRLSTATMTLQLAVEAAAPIWALRDSIYPPSNNKNGWGSGKGLIAFIDNMVPVGGFVTGKEIFAAWRRTHAGMSPNVYTTLQNCKRYTKVCRGKFQRIA